MIPCSQAKACATKYRANNGCTVPSASQTPAPETQPTGPNSLVGLDSLERCGSVKHGKSAFNLVNPVTRTPHSYTIRKGHKDIKSEHRQALSKGS